MDNPLKRTINEKSDEGEPPKKHEKEVEEKKEEVIESIRKKGFSTLPRHLQEWVLTKIDPDSRIKLFQTNNRLRTRILVDGPFGRDLKQIHVDLGSTEIYTRYGARCVIEARKSRLLKHIHTCKRLIIINSRRDFKMSESLSKLVVVADLDLFVWDFDRFREMFLGSSFQVTRYVKFLFFGGLLPNLSDENAKSVLNFIDAHQKGCKFVDFDEFPMKKAFEFLKEHEFLFVHFLMLDWSFVGVEEILEWILENGIPGTEQSGISLRIRNFERSRNLSEIMRIFSDKGPITMGDTAAIYQQFVDSFPDLPDSMTIPEVEGTVGVREMTGLKRKFDMNKNLVFLLSEGAKALRIMIRFERING